MDAKQLFYADGTPARVWQCSICKRFDYAEHHVNENIVEHIASRIEACCSTRGLCSECGEKAERWQTLCSKCRSAQWAAEQIEKEKAAFATATERTDYAGPFMFGDRYFEDINAVIEHCECHDIPIPAYVWVPERMDFSMDAGHILTDALDEHHEDADDEVNEKELQAILDDYCKRHPVTSWFESHKEYVRVPVEAPK